VDLSHASLALGLLIALGAGIVSFVSPCVLPLVPAYLSFVSGLSVNEMRGDAAGRSAKRILAPSLAFVIGFSVVFIALGATATAIGSFLYDRAAILAKVAAVLVVILGLHMIGVFRLGFLQRERKIEVNKRPAGILGAFVVGLAFAFGWTPCIGPVLGGILGYAASQDTVAKGILLLAAYSLGLGIPFIIAGLAINRFISLIGRVGKHLRIAEIASGVLLVIVGVLIFTGNLALLSEHLGFLSRFSK